MKLANQVALITGAGSGFGRASAVVFAKEGGKVSVVDVDDKGAQQTVEMVKQNGGEAIFFHADVAKAGDVENVIKTTVKQYGRIDILFNNAGIPMIRTPIEDLEEAVWDRILAVNLKGVFWGCKYAVPFMKKQGGGVIINPASIGGLRPRLRMDRNRRSDRAAGGHARNHGRPRALPRPFLQLVRHARSAPARSPIYIFRR